MNRNVVSWCCLFFSTPLMAFPCFFTLAKDSCWIDYDVTVVVTDADTSQQVLSINVPKGKSWTRQAFTCQTNQKLLYTATFEPTIWDNGKDAVYSAQHYWALPSAPTSKEKAWEIPVCYPAAFAAVPFPPNVSGNCQCDFDSIPAIPLQAS